jgi:hypothetical protein
VGHSALQVYQHHFVVKYNLRVVCVLGACLVLAKMMLSKASGFNKGPCMRLP